MKSVRRSSLTVLALIMILFPLSLKAEESGSGHYMPGASASFVDTLPNKPGLAVGNFFAYYGGSASVSDQLFFGGFVTADMDAKAYADTVVILYRPSLTLLGGFYATGVAIPYVWMTVKGKVQGPAPGGGTLTFKKRDTSNGIGDITLYPVMLGWTALGGDLKYDVRLGVYVPTGDYTKGDLANVGKNFWTFEPMITLSYFNKKGFELSAYTGVDFNTENHDTHYKSGDQFHADVTVAQHLPFLGNFASVGVNGFYYQQITGDSGSGAILGDCKGRTVGIGPTLSYVTKVRRKDLVVEIKWLPELDVGNRIEGDYIWFKLAMQF